MRLKWGYHHQWLCSPWPPHILRFRNPIETRGRTPLEEWSARRKCLYLHRTTEHRNTKTNIHASIGIRTHDPSNQAAKTYALDHAATGTGKVRLYCTHLSRYNNQCLSRLNGLVCRPCDVETITLSSDCGDCGRKKCERCCGGACAGVQRSLRLAWVWGLESGGRYCVVASCRNLASVAMIMFSRLI
jgi:hypothetical protein